LDTVEVHLLEVVAVATLTALGHGRPRRRLRRHLCGEEGVVVEAVLEAFQVGRRLASVADSAKLLVSNPVRHPSPP
jgi:hypothetical protein